MMRNVALMNVGITIYANYWLYWLITSGNEGKVRTMGKCVYCKKKIPDKDYCCKDCLNDIAKEWNCTVKNILNDKS